MAHVASPLLLASLCSFLACGGKGPAPGTDAGSTNVDTVPVEAGLELDRGQVDLGRVVLGTTGVTTLTVTNRGASASGIPTVRLSLSGWTDPRNATSLTISGCEAPLPPGGACELTLRFTPAVLGIVEGNLHVTAEPDAPSGTELSPFAKLAGKAIGFDISPPDDVALGDVVPGVSIRRTFTVTAAIDLTDLRPFASGEDLSLVASASTCTAVLPKGASCELAVDFLASTIGWKTAYFVVDAGGNEGQSEYIHFSANVSRSSNLSITPTSATLPCILTERGPPSKFTVTNIGPTASGTITATVVGEYSHDLIVSRTDCAVLAPQASCSLEVLCDSTSNSAAYPRGVLTVTDGSTHLSVPLTIGLASP